MRVADFVRNGIEFSIGMNAGGWYAEHTYIDQNGRLYAQRWYGPRIECLLRKPNPRYWLRAERF